MKRLGLVIVFALALVGGDHPVSRAQVIGRYGSCAPWPVSEAIRATDGFLYKPKTDLNGSTSVCVGLDNILYVPAYQSGGDPTKVVMVSLFGMPVVY